LERGEKGRLDVPDRDEGGKFLLSQCSGRKRSYYGKEKGGLVVSYPCPEEKSLPDEEKPLPLTS